MPEFDSPGRQLDIQSHFGAREVGLTHPDHSGIVRICDDGNIELTAGNGVSIVLNPTSRSISLNAEVIRLHTKHEGGLRWNRVYFNEHAVGFNEPTFITIDDDVDVKNMYRGVDYFIDGDLASSKFKFTDPASGELITLEEYAARFATTNPSEETVTVPKNVPNSLRDI